MVIRSAQHGAQSAGNSSSSPPMLLEVVLLMLMLQTSRLPSKPLCYNSGTIANHTRLLDPRDKNQRSIEETL